MSRIGRLPIDIPAGVTIEVDGQDVAVKGPKGELSLTVARPIEVKVEEGQVLVTRPDDERASRSLHGLTRTLINNNIIGVTQGYTKGLEVVGTGYRVAQKGSSVEFALGFSHPVLVEPARRDHLHGRGQQQAHRERHRQAGRRRGGCEHPQDPQARALQGQGCALRRRGRSAQGRKGW